VSVEAVDVEAERVGGCCGIMSSAVARKLTVEDDDDAGGGGSGGGGRMMLFVGVTSASMNCRQLPPSVL
jgi:hypothetical protein